jgi:hypothetical protein
MNALANDQEKRIKEYFEAAGVAGDVDVRKYDRGTGQAERERMRNNPPRILLTNDMLLEYLLIRPADRDALFANHRCRFLVLDEIHAYRGVLGGNIALLLRRLRAHLARARQDWSPSVPENQHAARYPTLLPVGTSATINSLAEPHLSAEERTRRRDADVKDFFDRLTGEPRDSIRVVGEVLENITIPTEARFSTAVRPPRPGGRYEPSLRHERPGGLRRRTTIRRRCRHHSELPPSLAPEPMARGPAPIR